MNGHPYSVLIINLSDNPNLRCVEVDDVLYSDTNWIDKESFTEYNTTCNNQCVTSVTEDDKKNSNITVFPNPTTGIIQIDSKEVIEKVIVRNVLGEIIKESKSTKIDIYNQANGIYFVEIITIKGKLSKKVILLR